MTSRVQQQRAEAANTPPPDNSLLPGQLYVELADPMRLWAGTPVSLSPTQKKILFDVNTYLPKAGGTMAGTLTLSGNPPGPADAVSKSYVDGATGASVPIAGGTMTGYLTLNADPVNPLHAATKRYVDTMVPLAGGTMTGLLALSGDPVTLAGAATKRYADTKLALAGGTMTGNLVLNADPTLPLGAVTKQYIDNRPSVTVGDTPPAGPVAGAMWWDSTAGQLYIRYQDPNNSSWVIANQSGVAEAPNDANTYGRHALGWAPVATQAAVTAAQNAANANVGRNVVHNSMMNVQQRTGPFTTSAWGIDRWLCAAAGSTFSETAAVLTDADRTAIGDEAARFCLQCVATGTGGAGDYVIAASQTVEDVRRLSGKTVLLSFWAKATAGTPKLGLDVYQNFGSGGSPSANVKLTAQAITLSTTWTRYTTTWNIPSAAGKTLGTTGGTDCTGLQLWMSSGATNNADAGGIGVQSYTLQLWGVQLEIAQPGQTQPTPLEKPDPELQLRQCQRFYQIGWAAACSNASVATQAAVDFATFHTAMRAAPSIVFSGQTYSNGNSATSVFVTPDTFMFQVSSAATGFFYGYSAFTASADL